jgi:hypothetical protein
MKTKWQKEMYENPHLWGKYIAIVQGEIIAIGDNYTDLKKKVAHLSQGSYTWFHVPQRLDLLRILPLRIMSLQTHPWIPTYPITFLFADGSNDTPSILIDSGADISVVSYEYGKLMGFQHYPDEVELSAKGVGGVVTYLLRKAKISINGYEFENHFAWFQDESIDEIIIGREIVFDLFDIEFKQAEEMIIFKNRSEII